MATKTVTKKKPKAPKPSEPKQVEPTPLTSEQWSELCVAAAAWHMLTRAKVSELFESVNRTLRAMFDENSPLREFLDPEDLREVRRYLEQAEMAFPEFGTAAPTSMNLPDLMELLASFK